MKSGNASTLLMIISLSAFLGMSCSPLGERSAAGVPSGWRELEHPGSGVVLGKKQVLKGEDVSISLDWFRRYDPEFPKTEAGCAASYQSAIASLKDDEIRMEKVRGCEIGEYRYYSDYYGDNLVSFILTDSGFATVELWCRSARQREEHREDFRRVVGGVKKGAISSGE